MELVATVEFDYKKMAEGLGLDLDTLHEWASDSRNVNQLVQQRIKSELGMQTKKVKGGAKHLLGPNASEWVVRCLNRQGGVSFVRSYMKGYRRGFEKEEWLNWILGIDGFLVANICDFPSVDIYKVHADEVLDHFESGANLPELSFTDFESFKGAFCQTEIPEDADDGEFEEVG